jgi:hypothetical protein
MATQKFKAGDVVRILSTDHGSDRDYKEMKGTVGTIDSVKNLKFGMAYLIKHPKSGYKYAFPDEELELVGKGSSFFGAFAPEIKKDTTTEDMEFPYTGYLYTCSCVRGQGIQAAIYNTLEEAEAVPGEDGKVDPSHDHIIEKVLITKIK